MAPQRIQRQRTKGWRMPPGTVYIGRPTMWGNPFPIDHEGVAMHCLTMGLDGRDATDRAAASVDLFHTWMTNGKVNELVGLFLPRLQDPPSLRIVRRDLGGRDLCCWCRVGSPCHADVLLELACEAL